MINVFNCQAGQILTTKVKCIDLKTSNAAIQKEQTIETETPPLVETKHPDTQKGNGTGFNKKMIEKQYP